MVHTRPFIYRPIDILRSAHVKEYVGYLSAYRQQSRVLPSMIYHEVWANRSNNDVGPFMQLHTCSVSVPLCLGASVGFVADATYHSMKLICYFTERCYSWRRLSTFFVSSFVEVSEVHATTISGSKQSASHFLFPSPWWLLARLTHRLWGWGQYISLKFRWTAGLQGITSQNVV
jgi:hypothetical protein